MGKKNNKIGEIQSGPIKKKGSLRRKLIWLLIVYLLTDLRLFLLIPNTILYFVPAKVQNNQRCMQVNIFPRLTIGNDPVFAHISNINGSENVIPAGTAFERNYDRSGIYPEFQFSGICNFQTAVESTNWMIGRIGGLCVGKQVIHRGNRLTKKIWLNDYLDLTQPGLYSLRLKYDIDKQFDKCDLTFFLLHIPENPIAKLLKQCFNAALLYAPIDGIRTMAAKSLGYEPTSISAQILCGYYCKVHPLWADDKSGEHSFSDSLFWANKGVIRNPAASKELIKKCRTGNDTTAQILLDQYLSLNCLRLYESSISINNRKEQAKKLVELLYSYTSPEKKESLKNHLVKLKEVQTDEFCLKQVLYCRQHQIEDPNSLPNNLDFWQKQLDEKSFRQERTDFMESVLGTINTIENSSNGKSAVVK